TPYMDATSSWGFRSRWRRMLVGAAGMLVELFVAAIATFIWANTGPGTPHNLAYNMMFVASVSTLLFNGNPLLRYDGYYMLSDLLEIPNLYQRAALQLRYWAERYLFGIRRAENPAHSRREATWLSVYGVASYIYRVIVFGGILLFVADRFLIFGILMAVACAISWVLVPIGRLIYYLATSPQLERQRNRAIVVSAGIALGLLGWLELIPFPAHFRAPGLLEAQNKVVEVNDAPGTVVAVLATPGSRVKAGQPLVRLQNRELDLQLEAARARRAEVQALIRESLEDNAVNLAPLQKQLASASDQIQRLERDEAAQVVKARQAGIWVAPEVKHYVGRWLPRGADLGLVLDPSSFYFTATVAESDVSPLFGREFHNENVRLRGQAGELLTVTGLKIIPAGQTNLPSAALGWRGGGEVPVSLSDPTGRRTMEPFFEIRAAIQPRPDVALLHGRSGKIRFDLPAEPLLHQWIRRLRQVLQRRYQL
ncbi:MAG: biotin/lipoyl-binding protein, partial [Verrucomicrobia bacterium]|nr:biotin/lipoyl-binding protein [Verrucomicrobiota bacterium]